ncbi:MULTISPECIES: 5'-3' exonuclease H3TH domain-containing protein [unclassified Rudaea]|uniref:5'-3' exonuclease n=1 Tax=unclassified Rudaea TaxID=2627037 RepID=UPI0020164D1E|nr:MULTISPECIES: 5'-3' exonuclease H3TH domain-containing protein [unclassified Rudaea]
MQTVHLIDSSLYVFRAWHSLPDEFHDVDGAPVNAVQGYTRFLCDFLERVRPTHVLAAFDESLVSSFRNGIYPEYKANRELPPPELKVQFAYCKQVAAALGLTVLADEQYEADDLIGSAVEMSRKENFRSVIVSADKDFGQLVGLHDEQWDFSKNERWDAQGVKQRLGVRPDQVVDYLALTGDAVDNIPGVPGVGPKTAATLLAHFGTLDALLTRIEEVPYLRLRGAAQVYAKIKAHRDQALLSQRLSAIVLDAPIPDRVEALRWRIPDHTALDALFDRLRFGPLTRSRCRQLVPAAAAA